MRSINCNLVDKQPLANTPCPLRFDTVSLSPEILNDAMCAYIQTYSMRDRLEKHITKHGLEQHREEIFAELDAVFETAWNHLSNYPGGVPWTDQFQRSYRTLLVEKHPWLNAKSLDKVFSYSGWICWHEGLNAPGV